MEQKPRIFLQNIHNRPAGGPKVVHQLARLFESHGYEAFVFSPSAETSTPKWLLDPANIIDNETFQKMCTEEDIVIGEWPDKITSELIRDCPAKIKIYYPQSNFTLTGQGLIGPEIFTEKWGYTNFWAVSNSNKEILDAYYNISCVVVHPYFNTEIFSKNNNLKRKNQILALSRKGNKYVQEVSKKLGDRLKILENPFTEQDFITAANESAIFLHTAMGHQPNMRKKIRAWIKYIITLGKKDSRIGVVYAGSKYDEGFPLPPAEATLSGCVIVGFAKNGDLEWMNSENSFITQNGNARELTEKLEQALALSSEEKKSMNDDAKRNLGKFLAQNTWGEINKSIDI